MHDVKDFNVPANPYGDEVEAVLIGEEELHARIAEMAHRVNEKYKDADSDLILVAVLKGAVFFLTDFARQDLDRDIEGRDVVIVEDIIDSGLTLSWLMKNLRNRNPRSLEVITLLRKPEAVRTSLDVADVGFDIPNEFVIGYGLDYAERYRDLPYVGTLHPRVYQG